MIAFRLWRNKLLSLHDVTSGSAVQLTVAFLCISIHQIISAVEVETPSLEVRVISPTADKEATTETLREIILVIAVCCTVIAGLTIALVWVDVAERARRMIHRGLDSSIPRTRRAVLVFEVTIVFVMIAACALDAPNIAVFVGLFVVVVCMVFYVVGFYRIAVELRAMVSIATETNKKYYSSVMIEISRIAIVVVLCEVAVFIICIVIIVTGVANWKENSLPNAIPPPVIAWQLLPTALLGLDGALLTGLFKATNRRITNKSSDFSANAVDKPSTANDIVRRKTELDAFNPTVKSSLESTAQHVAAYQVDHSA